MVGHLFVAGAQENVLTKTVELQDLRDALEALETGWYPAVRPQETHNLTIVQRRRFRVDRGTFKFPLLLTK
jgi:hypothetical protein